MEADKEPFEERIYLRMWQKASELCTLSYERMRERIMVIQAPLLIYDRSRAGALR